MSVSASEFKVVSEFAPAGDQPKAIAQLAEGVQRGDRFQTLLGITGSGKSATFGWADIPRLEELRNAWFDAPTVEAQAAICREMQRVSFETVPYIPTGVFYQPTAYRKSLVDVPRGFPQFYGVKRA